MICPQCKNQDPKYFHTFNNITYCRKCIKYGQPGKIAPVTNKKSNLSVDYKLINLLHYNKNYQITY